MRSIQRLVYRLAADGACVIGREDALPELGAFPSIGFAGVAFWIAHGISHRVMRQAANTMHEPMMAMNMSMTPPFCGAPTRTRTEDPWFKRPLLYRLSYRGWVVKEKHQPLRAW